MLIGTFHANTQYTPIILTKLISRRLIKIDEVIKLLPLLRKVSITLLSISLLFIIMGDAYSIADSPSFPRQIITDGTYLDIERDRHFGYDWFDIDTGEPLGHITGNDWFSKNFNISGINEVSYISDGKTLNTTIWFPEQMPFNEKPTEYIATYGMLIDIDPFTIYSPDSSGWEGTDYVLKLSFDNNTKNWNKVFEEWTNSGNTKILDIDRNITNFFDQRNNRYIDLTLDLKAIGNPRSYNLMFFEIVSFQKMNRHYDIVDFSEWTSIPEPQFVANILPSFLELKPGEDEFLRIEVNSTNSFNFNYAVTVETRNDDNKDIKMQFIRDDTHLPKHESGWLIDELFIYPPGTRPSNSTSTLHVQVLPNATVGPHIIPIYFEISYLSPEYGPLNFLPFITEKEVNNPTIKYNYTQSVYDTLTYNQSTSGLDDLESNFVVNVKGFTINEFVNDLRGNILALWNENKEFLVIISTLVGIFTWILKRFSDGKKK